MYRERERYTYTYISISIYLSIYRVNRGSGAQRGAPAGVPEQNEFVHSG